MLWRSENAHRKLGLICPHKVRTLFASSLEKIYYNTSQSWRKQQYNILPESIVLNNSQSETYAKIQVLGKFLRTLSANGKLDQNFVERSNEPFTHDDATAPKAIDNLIYLQNICIHIYNATRTRSVGLYFLRVFLFLFVTLVQNSAAIAAAAIDRQRVWTFWSV